MRPDSPLPERSDTKRDTGNTQLSFRFRILIVGSGEFPAPNALASPQLHRRVRCPDFGEPDRCRVIVRKELVRVADRAGLPVDEVKPVEIYALLDHSHGPR